MANTPGSLEIGRGQTWKIVGGATGVAISAGTGSDTWVAFFGRLRLADDAVRRFGPDERSRVLVPVSQEGLDVATQGCFGRETGAA